MNTQDNTHAEGGDQGAHRRNSKPLTWLAGAVLGFGFGSIVLVGPVVSAFGTALAPWIQSNCPDKSGALRRSRPADRAPVGVAAPRSANRPPTGSRGGSSSSASTISIAAPGRFLGPGVDWRRLDLLDTDDDGEIDVIRIELDSGKVLTWRVARQ